MTIEEKRRELFESYAKQRDLSVIRANEGYMFGNSAEAWAAFNAALDAVVIDLPPDWDTGHEIVIETTEIYRAIQSTGLGLKVKP